MDPTQNPWDILSKKTFNAHLKKGEIDPQSADNILIAWPSILKLVIQEFPNPKGIKVLDFGCGTGGFCNKLYELGFDVTGIDPSVEMIKIARQNSAQGIHYYIGNQSSVVSLGTFHIIVSVMTLPFIKNMESAYQDLTNTLIPKRIIGFCRLQ